MTEQDAPAGRRKHQWPADAPDILLRFVEPQRTEPPRRDAASIAAGAEARRALRSGYEEIIAARTALRARAHFAVRRPEEGRPPPIGVPRPSHPAASAVAAARPSRANAAPAPPRRSRAEEQDWDDLPMPARRRLHPGLAILGSLVAPPVCALLAFTWLGPLRLLASDPDEGSPPFVSADVGGAPLSAGEEPAFGVQGRHSAPESGALEAKASETYARFGAEPSALRDAASFRAASSGAGDDAAGLRALRDNASSHPALAGAAGGSATRSAPEEPASAARDRKDALGMADAASDVSPPKHGPTIKKNGSNPAAEGPAEAAAVASGADGADPGTLRDDGRTLLATEAAQKGAEAGVRPPDTLIPPSMAAAAGRGTAPDAVPFWPWAAADAGNMAAAGKTRVPAAVEPPGQQPAAGAGSASAPTSAGLREAGPATASVARSAGTDAASAKPVQPTSAASAPTPPPLRSASLPSPMAATLSGITASAGAPPADRRADAPLSPPLPDPRCRAIVLKAQLGEETSHAERSLLRSGCGTRR